jgi:hypothetical protein
LLIKRLFGEPDHESIAELAEHLRACPECARREAAYVQVRDEVRSMEPIEPPGELAEMLALGLQEALTRGTPPKRAPADPKPELAGYKKALIVGTVLIFLVALTVGLFVVFSGERAPVPNVAAVALLSGTADVRTPGSSDWHQARPREFLPPGVQLRTGPDSALKLRAAGVEWWLPAISAMGLEEPGLAELLVGRVYARCDGSKGSPVKLVSANGTVTCNEGEFSAVASLKRLRVGCISGSVQVGEEGQQTRLNAGQCAMLVERSLSGPTRSARPGELAHWLLSLEEYGGRCLSPRQRASVRVTPQTPILRNSVRIDDLGITAVVRGPVALVSIAAVLHNGGTEPWRGSLSAADVLLPPVLAQAESEPIELAPGVEAACRTAAVCLLQGRDGFYALGVNPNVWTRGEIGRLNLRVSASAEGGLRTFDCPTMNCRLKRPEHVDWAVSRDRVSPATPVVLEFEFERADCVDALQFETAKGVRALAAWRPDPPGDEWLRKARNVFIAVDVAADFGGAGRTYEQEAAEALLSCLPPGCATALIAYDGGLKVERSRLALHLPLRVEAMLEGLWCLNDNGESRTRDFLHEAVALASGAQGGGLLIFVTGRDQVGDLSQVADAAKAAGIRVAVLQVGSDDAAPAYRALTGATGGVALGLPDSEAPELAVLDFLANLRVSGTAGASVATEKGIEAAAFPPAGNFANQPVTGLLEAPSDANPIRGRFSMMAGERRLVHEFTLQVKGDIALSGALADELVRGLEARTAP